jgi:hypothetical protein
MDVTFKHLEINKELVISTAHVRESTFAALCSGNPKYTPYISFDRYDYGVRIYIELTEMLEPEVSGHIPLELFKVMQLAHDKDCKWLVLDQDGDVVPWLNTWEW